MRILFIFFALLVGQASFAATECDIAMWASHLKDPEGSKQKCEEEMKAYGLEEYQKLVPASKTTQFYNVSAAATFLGMFRDNDNVSDVYRIDVEARSRTPKLANLPKKSFTVHALTTQLFRCGPRGATEIDSQRTTDNLVQAYDEDYRVQLEWSRECVKNRKPNSKGPATARPKPSKK